MHFRFFPFEIRISVRRADGRTLTWPSCAGALTHKDLHDLGKIHANDELVEQLHVHVNNEMDKFRADLLCY